MQNDSPSPFTILVPTFIAVEGGASEPPPVLVQPMTVNDLICNLTIFADHYENARSNIERVSPLLRRSLLGSLAANTDFFVRTFKATPGIERIRAYTLAHFGKDLTLGTANQFRGDLIRANKLTTDSVGALTLDAAMDLLENKGVEVVAIRELLVAVRDNNKSLIWEKCETVRKLLTNPAGGTLAREKRHPDREMRKWFNRILDKLHDPGPTWFCNRTDEAEELLMENPTSSIAANPPASDESEQDDEGDADRSKAGGTEDGILPQLPQLLSASDIANRIGRNPKSVTSFLSRFAAKKKDCRVSIPTKRKNEPAHLYRTADVWPQLEIWMKDGGND